MTTRKIMVVPGMAKSRVYAPAESTSALGGAGWARRSSASIPPIRENRKAVTPYRIPTRLSATVEIQLQNPWSVSGRSNSRVGDFSRTATGCPLLSQRSLQRLQVGHDLGHLVVGEAAVGHAYAIVGTHRFHVPGIGHPLGEGLRRVVEDVAGVGLAGL